MKLLISGSSGFIGTELLSFLPAKGYEAFRLARPSAAASTKSEGVIFWDIEKQQLDSEKLENFDAMIHLVGENIGEGRWTDEKKQRILDSRVKSTELLANKISQLKNPPRVLISASAVGYYGNRGDQLCEESMPGGAGFLADVCRQWEAALAPVSAKGIRTVILRNGIVLSTKGGVLKKLLFPFSWGLGGIVGSGKQFMSWIAMEDLLNAIHFVLQNENIRGPINAVAPEPVTNAAFTQSLAKTLKRPAFFPVPTFLLRTLLGRERADELLLSSIRAVPLGFWKPVLFSAIRHWIKR